VKRREFITGLGGAAVAWPVVARAQQPKMPVIGFMNGSSPETYARPLAAFRQGLGETGYDADRNVAGRDQGATPTAALADDPS
jgi:putative ABC transport system substrate-binding protein